jgi:CheY-like chemotaxis protein
MKKILVVDDSKEIRMLVIATLENDDYTLLEAENADKAVLISAEEKPDLIIMDVHMPGALDGLKATKIIKSAKETSKSKIIMLTGAKSKNIIDEAGKAGADGFLQKPFSPLELIENVERALKSTDKKKKT